MLPVKYRDAVIKDAHIAVGHQALAKTLVYIQQDYVWPGMRSEVRAYLEDCAVCQAHDSRKRPGEMQIMPDPKYPFQIMGMDLTGPLPTSTKSGAKYLLTVIDHPLAVEAIYKNKTCL